MPESKEKQEIHHQDSWRREGPKPLSLHMNLALAQKAAGAFTDAEMTAFLRGVRKYQAHPFRRQMPALETLWNHKGVSLRYCPAEKQAVTVAGQTRKALFIVPSLINNIDIFDLLPDKSFIRWMAQRGVSAYIIDWDNLENENPDCSMETLFGEYIFPALKAARNHFTAVGRSGKMFGLGYCMGGTLLTAALCAKEAACLDGAVLLASPWDFRAGEQSLTNRVRALKVNAAQILSGRPQCLPVDMVQSVFASLDPAQTVRKFSRFSEMEAGGPEEKVFIATEDWLNTGRDIPHAIARTIIFDWYDRNMPAQEKWSPFGGRHICPQDSAVPVLVLASKRDRLVPFRSAAALADKLPKAVLRSPDSGHIGFMAGHDAGRKIWPAVHDWLCEQAAKP